MIRRPPRSTQSRSSAASDVYKRQGLFRGHPTLSHVPAPYRQSSPGGPHQVGPGGLSGARAGPRFEGHVSKVALGLGEVLGAFSHRPGGSPGRSTGQKYNDQAAGVVAQGHGPGGRQAAAGRGGEGPESGHGVALAQDRDANLSLIHISEPTRLGMISYAV